MRNCWGCGRDSRGEFCEECQKSHGGLNSEQVKREREEQERAERKGDRK